MATFAKSEVLRRKLIDAAGATFAAVGYEAATVRQITDLARANVAAINYHFGDKRQLYRAVLKAINDRVVALLEQNCCAELPEERLYQFVHSILQAESGHQYPWAYQLMAREVAGMQQEQADLLAEAVRPLHDFAEKIVADLMRAPGNNAEVRTISSLLITLCVNRLPQFRLDQRLYPDMQLSELTLEKLSEQICQFVLAGIGSLSHA